MAVIFLSASNVVPFRNDEDATFDLQNIGLADVLDFQQSVHLSLIKISISSNLIFTQEARKRNINISVINYLQFIQVASPRAGIVYASNALQFTQKAAKTKLLSASNSLIFTHIAQNARSLISTFHLISEAHYTIRVAQVCHHVLDFKSGTNVFKENNPDFIAIPVPPILSEKTITLTFGALSLVLRSPVFGNKDKVELRRINRRSRGNDLIAFRDPIWSKEETLEYEIEALTESQAKAYLNFVEQTLGQLITLLDYEGFVWQGIIANPDETEITQNMQGCGYTAKLTFEGSKV